MISVVTTIKITTDTAVFSYHRIITAIAILIVSLEVFLNAVSWKPSITSALLTFRFTYAEVLTQLCEIHPQTIRGPLL